MTRLIFWLWQRRRWSVETVIVVGVMGLLLAGLLTQPAHPVQAGVGGIGAPMTGASSQVNAPAAVADLNCWWPPDYLACTVQGVDNGANSQLNKLWQIDFLLDTPPAITYSASNHPIVDSQALLLQAVNTLLVLAVIVAGILLLFGGIFGGQQPREWLGHLPQIVLAFLGAQVSLLFCSWVIDLNNALADPFRATVKGGALLSMITTLINQGDVFLLLLVLVYIVVLLVFTGQMLYRLALICLLIILSPLGMLCFALPQTQSWGRWWMNTFVVTTLTQFVQLVALAIGVTLMAAISPHFSAAQQIFQMFWGLAFLYLTLKLPSLLRSLGQNAGGMTGELAGGVMAVAGLATIAMTGGSFAVAAGATIANKPLQAYSNPKP